MARALIGWFLLLASLLAGCAGAAGPCDPTAGCTRILFVGNSYTSVNDLPALVARLAGARGHRVEVTAVTVDGATLADHVESGDVQRGLAGGRWSVVVLQEQSEVPAAPDLRASEMLPAVTRLADLARTAGARVVLFQTWAHRDGWPERGLPGYRRMQTAIDDGYALAAKAAGAEVVPVGDAWSAASAATPSTPLWQADGSHATVAGTYLAACAFVASLFSESPVGLPAVDGVSQETATSLQQAIAGATSG